MSTLAAMRDECLRYVIFKGIHHDYYQDFFVKALEDRIWEDEYRYEWFLDDDGTEILLTPGEDVFLINHILEVYLMPLAKFSELYYPVDQVHASPKHSLVEYLLYSGEREVYPRWFMDAIGGVDPTDYCGVIDRFLPNEYVLEQEYVILRNRYKDISVVPFHVFDKHFIYR